MSARTAFLTSALAFARANGQTPDEARALVAYVHGRPRGEPDQEMGGVTTTLALLADFTGLRLAGFLAAGRFQARNAKWMSDVFEGDPTDLVERVSRFVEECLEMHQAVGGTADKAELALAKAHEGDPGTPDKGLLAVTRAVLVLADEVGLDALACGERELTRLETPAMRARIREKRSRRHGRGPLPGWVAEAV